MKSVLEVNLNKLTHNAEKIVEVCKQNGVSVMGVTKGFGALSPIAEALIKGGVDHLADARIENIIKLKDSPIKKVLLRMPALSEIKEVVKYADVSLNSEIETIKALSNEAEVQNTVHKIILMVDVGELREGILPEAVLDTVKRIRSLKGISIYGVGTTLTCISGVLPDAENLGVLAAMADTIEKLLKYPLQIVSGGNSSSYILVENESMPKRINNLRLGEALLLGRETAYGHRISGTCDDAFILKAEIVELKEKPSLPKGEIGMDAFGKTPKFEDKGDMKRALLAIGIQDIEPDTLIPVDEDVEIIGGSSDYIALDLTHCKKSYVVGDHIEFKLSYGGIMRLFTSEFVVKRMV